MGDYIVLQLKYIMCCNKNVRTQKKQALFAEAVNKLDSHFDIVKLIKTIRRTELLTNVILKKHHEYFLPILKQSLLMGKINEYPDDDAIFLSDDSLT